MNERMKDLLEQYGEVCDQKVAAKILNIVPRTVFRMLQEGRLRRIGHRVDVRSIAEYLENPRQADFMTETMRRTGSMRPLNRDDFLAAARRGNWTR